MIPQFDPIYLFLLIKCIDENRIGAVLIRFLYNLLSSTFERFATSSPFAALFGDVNARFAIQMCASP